MAPRPLRANWDEQLSSCIHYGKGEKDICNTGLPATHPTAAMEIVVNDSKAFPSVVAPVSSAHQVLDDQAHIN